jgi:hypothetical protein
MKKIDKKDFCLFFSRLNEDSTSAFRSFLTREDLSLYNRIIIKDSVVTSEMLDIIYSLDGKQDSLVVSFENCKISEDIKDEIKDAIPTKSLIIEVNKSLIVLPGKILINVNKSIENSIYFLSNERMVLKDFDFSNSSAVDALDKILANKFNLKQIIIDGNGTNLTSQVCKIFPNLNKYHSQEFCSLNVIVKNKTNPQVFLDVNHKIPTIIENKIVIGDKSITIPMALSGMISFNSPNIVTINGSEELFLFKKENENEIKDFINTCIDKFNGIELNKCKLSKNFVTFFSKLNIPSKEIRIIGFKDCSIDKTLLDMMFEESRKKQNIVFKWNNLINIGAVSDGGTLELNPQNIEVMSKLLLSNPVNFYGLSLKNIDLNDINCVHINNILKNKAVSKNFRFIKFFSCEFHNAFLSCLDTIRSYQVPIHEGYFIDINNTEEAKLALAASRNMGWKIYFNDIPSSFIANRGESKNGTKGRPYNEGLKALISKAEPHQKPILENFCAMNVGYPMEVLAKRDGKPFHGVNLQQVEKNIKSIYDSWIMGYDKEKKILISIIMSYMENKGMSKSNYVLFYGPPGIGKTTFIFATAAVLHYIDTGNLSEALYDPKVDLDIAKKRFAMIVGSEVTDKSVLLGFAKAYKDSHPGQIINALKTDDDNVFTKIIGIDEIDKIGKKEGGNLVEFLTGIIEANSRMNFQDQYLSVGIDLNPIIMIATANNISLLPDHIKSRFNMIEIPPLPMNKFIEMATIKWGDTCQRFGVVKSDYEWSAEDFTWFVEINGSSAVRKLIGNFEILAGKISAAKKQKIKLIINKKYLMGLFKDLTDQIDMIENKSGKIDGILQNQSGAYSVMTVIASSAGRDRGDHINYIPTSIQNRDQGIHGSKVSIQSSVYSIIYSLQQSGVLDGYKIKLNQCFNLATSDTFGLDDMAYFAIQGVLAIVSEVANKPIGHILAVGCSDISGSFFATGLSEDIKHRLNAGLTGKSKKIRDIFLPKNMSNDAKNECEEIIKNWMRIHQITNVKIHFVDSAKDIVVKILEDEETKQG